MNGLERYLATIECRPVDHLARVPILMQYAAEHIGSHYGAFASDYQVLTAANLVCYRQFGIDQVSTISDPYRETQGYGAKIICGRDMVPYCEKHPLEDDPDLTKITRPDPNSSERMCDRIEAVRAYRARRRRILDPRLGRGTRGRGHRHAAHGQLLHGSDGR